MPVTVTDFSRSYVRWSIPPDPDDTRQPGHMPWGNSVRIQIDAACTITDESNGGRETFYLIAPCRKEWMYRETGLIMEPGAEYRAIFDRDRQLDVAMSAHLHGDRPLPSSTAGFTSLVFEISTLPATPLESDTEIVRATGGNAPIVARTSIENTERGLTALLEYPVRTMNYHPERRRFQVDTGPLIFADLSRETAHPIEHCLPPNRSPRHRRPRRHRPLPLLRNPLPPSHPHPLCNVARSGAQPCAHPRKTRSSMNEHPIGSCNACVALR
jgi:hypothetical protein